jgi:hypothetical protein
MWAPALAYQTGTWRPAHEKPLTHAHGLMNGIDRPKFRGPVAANIAARFGTIDGRSICLFAPQRRSLKTRRSQRSLRWGRFFVRDSKKYLHRKQAGVPRCRVEQVSNFSSSACQARLQSSGVVTGCLVKAAHSDGAAPLIFGCYRRQRDSGDLSQNTSLRWQRGQTYSARRIASGQSGARFLRQTSEQYCSLNTAAGRRTISESNNPNSGLRAAAATCLDRK